MKKDKTINELNKAILLLEEQQVIQENLLREQFNLAYESIKPANLVRNTIKDLISSSSLGDNALNSTIGITAGLLSKKIISGSGKNMFRKLLGTVVQLGITNTIIQNPETVKSIGQFIVNQVIGKEKENVTSESQ
jgi:hypothetical protein